MSREIILSQRARRQLAAALRWWYQHRDKAPDAFDEDFAALWNLLKHGPDIGQPVRTRRGGVRRILMPRVRYYVYYCVSESGTVEVITIWHSSRRAPRL